MGEQTHILMKTKFNFLAMFLGAVLLALPDVVNAQFACTTNNGAITITGYTGPGGAVVLPSTINGLPVTSIETNTFQLCFSLTSVTIPNSVTRIGDSAFFDCGSLTNVTIGTNVTSLEGYAFGNCTNLTDVKIPIRVTNIGVYAFGYCGMSNLTIPDSVTSIGIGAFYDCCNLTNITIGTNLTSISSSAFYYCTYLAHVAIPNNVTNIGAGAFGFSRLTSVTIGANVNSIGDDAFCSCSRLTGIYFQGNAPSVGSGVFSGDYNATVYYLPGTSGWSSPFGGCPAGMLNPPNPAGSLKVTLAPGGAINAGAQWQVDGGVAQPSGAIVPGLSIGNHTVSFTGANGWAMPANQSVVVSANSTVAASGSFFQLAYTTNDGAITLTGYHGFGGALVLPNTINGLPVTRIGDYAFYFWSSLTSMTISDSVTNIGNAAFQNSSLTNVIIGSGVTTIGTNAFYRCYSLANVTLGTNLTIIGDFAFDQCLGLSKVIIPDSVTRIGSWAFYHCINLTNVTIGNSVTNIGEDAFYDCSHLTGIYFQGNAPSLAPEPFNADRNLAVYYLPWTKGWGTSGAWFGGCPTALWPPQAQTSDATFGVQTNQFGFNITWASDLVVVVEACTNLADPAWTPVGTNTLTGGSSYFSDPDWTNYPGRFYRLRSQ